MTTYRRDPSDETVWSHDLARAMLEHPDMPVVVSEGDDPEYLNEGHVESVRVETDPDELRERGVDISFVKIICNLD